MRSQGKPLSPKLETDRQIWRITSDQSRNPQTDFCKKLSNVHLVSGPGSFQPRLSPRNTFIHAVKLYYVHKCQALWYKVGYDGDALTLPVWLVTLMSVWGNPGEAVFGKTDPLDKQEKQVGILAACFCRLYWWGWPDAQGCKCTNWCPWTRGFFLPLVSPNLNRMAVMGKMSVCPDGAKITLKGINDRAYWSINLSVYWFLVAGAWDSLAHIIGGKGYL